MTHSPGRWTLTCLAAVCGLGAALKGPPAAAALTLAASATSIALLWGSTRRSRTRLRFATLLASAFPLMELAAGLAGRQPAQALAGAALLAALRLAYLEVRDEQRRSVIDGVLRASGQDGPGQRTDTLAMT